jgi:hypothetical protein
MESTVAVIVTSCSRLPPVSVAVCAAAMLGGGGVEVALRSVEQAASRVMQATEKTSDALRCTEDLHWTAARIGAVRFIKTREAVQRAGAQTRVMRLAAAA